MIDIDRELLADLARSGRLEWLETNGLGGWAGSTLCGAHSRRHHQLLRLPPPAGPGGDGGDIRAGGAGGDGGAGGVIGGQAQPAGARTIALAKLDEMVVLDGRVQDLSCNRFPFVLSCPGLRHLARFQRDLFPAWEIEAGGIRLRKTLLLVEGEDTLVALYEVLAAPAPFVLALRPFLSIRQAHHLGRADTPGAVPAIGHDERGLALRWPAGETLHLASPGAGFDRHPDWWYRFELEEERLRGLDFQEDLWTPGLLHRQLGSGDRFAVVAAAADPAGRDAGDLAAQERRRRDELLTRLPVEDELTRVLALAGDQFVVRRSGGLRNLVAGYPRAEEATADALVALPGLLLATGRTAEAKRLLRGLARAVAGGALPDRLPSAGTAAPAAPYVGTAAPAAPGAPAGGRSSLDASLWFAVAVHRYWQATGDDASLRDSLLPALAKIAAGHERGAPSGLRAAGDGLLEAVPDSPAAAVRPGKAAEINALWINALTTLAEHGARLGAAEAAAWGERARRLQRRYGEVFWNAAAGFLFDSVETAAPPAPADARVGEPTLAPHQVLAIGLPFPALSKARGQRLLAALEERLYTPAGLRDHHGLTWPWLAGPFLSALIRLRGAAGRRQALQHLAELDAQLAGGVVGSLPELAGAEPPFAPGGHLASAASIGELLRVYVAELRTPPPSAPPAAPRTRPAPPAKGRPKKAAPPPLRGGRKGGRPRSGDS